MYWVLQNNIYEEEGFDHLVEALTRLDLPIIHTKVVPFEGRLEPVSGEIPPDGAKAIVLGSYTLARVARHKNWQPGAFLDNLDFQIQLSKWGDLMLNADAKIFEFAKIPEQIEPFFLRPVHDTKAFTGMVVDWPYYVTWRDGLLRMPEAADPVYDPLGVSVLHPGSSVMVCKKKEIWSETRTWIIDGRLITASGYKLGTIKRYIDSTMVDQAILHFAVDCARKYSPNRAYVLDIADTPDGYKIVEVNNLNSAGFYKADVSQLVMGLENMCYET